MKLFLDTSVLLAACGSTIGASREIFRRAPQNHWTLLTTPYVIHEVAGNLSHLPPAAGNEWDHLFSLLVKVDDVFVLDRPSVFEPGKDRPVLFSALAWSDILLTLDQADFHGLMEKPFYGLRILRPGIFLQLERAEGRLL